MLSGSFMGISKFEEKYIKALQRLQSLFVNSPHFTKQSEKLLLGKKSMLTQQIR